MQILWLYMLTFVDSNPTFTVTRTSPVGPRGQIRVHMHAGVCEGELDAVTRGLSFEPNCSEVSSDPFSLNLVSL